MRNYFLLIAVLVLSCTQSSQNGAALLESLKPLTIPTSTADLPHTLTSKDVKSLALDSEAEIALKLADTTTHSPGFTSYHWLVGRLGERKQFVTVVGSWWEAGETKGVVQYSVVTYTPEGKLIEALVVSDRTGEEGVAYEVESVFKEDGSIVVSQQESQEGEENSPGIVNETIYNIDESGKFKVIDKKQYAEEIQVDWYHLQDAGLLSIEKDGSNSIKFFLTTGLGESCTGEVSGTATVQEDDSFYYGGGSPQLPCSIEFRLEADKAVLTEAEDQMCEHGANCPFGGDYKKVATETVSRVNDDIKLWVRQPVEKFSCLLAKTYSYEEKGYKCGVKAVAEYDPSDPSWTEGPVFPKEKVKAVHPLISNIELGFEHGDLRTVSITLDKAMTLQSIQRIFQLPLSLEPYPKAHENIMEIVYDGLDNNSNTSINPAFIKQFTIVGFEHMGAGD